MDKEHIKILTDGEKLKLMTEHQGWGVARQLLCDKILSLQMIGDLKGLDPQRMTIMVEAKTLAKDILWEFLMSDIEGTVEQLVNNNPSTLIEEDYIVRES